MSQQLITKTKKNKPKKNIIFIIEGEFDITRMSELPDHIVHYCISFLATEETEDWYSRNGPRLEDWWTELKEFHLSRPSKWFERLLRSETERLWNTKYVPELTKAFNKIPVAKLQKMTSDGNCWKFVRGCYTKRDWIKHRLDFSNYSNYRVECIETILASKGLTFPHYNGDEEQMLYLEPYNPENFVCKI